ncbi:hypothetical protein [Mariluticola halotolerans]|uniref:hypothetical protein n=1 Tax=Mariluticola halotolerans TaxID=2909283 RepID=UPI0026E32515|nr:hypothetical protein [Mariluticola halotolerans]UJQ94879.1 hypothetical protein L1P08_02500 [Mariluticola halotolerans]
MGDKDYRRFDRQFDRLERQVPRGVARFLMWLRRPYARLVRIPLGLVLVLGGVFSFLPVLGIWMLPLGLLLLAVDLPFLRGPLGSWLVRGQRWWERRRRRK